MVVLERGAGGPQESDWFVEASVLGTWPGGRHAPAPPATPRCPCRRAGRTTRRPPRCRRAGPLSLSLVSVVTVNSPRRPSTVQVRRRLRPRSRLSHAVSPATTPATIPGPVSGEPHRRALPWLLGPARSGAPKDPQPPQVSYAGEVLGFASARHLRRSGRSEPLSEPPAWLRPPRLPVPCRLYTRRAPPDSPVPHDRSGAPTIGARDSNVKRPRHVRHRGRGPSLRRRRTRQPTPQDPQVEHPREPHR